MKEPVVIVVGLVLAAVGVLLVVRPLAVKSLLQPLPRALYPDRDFWLRNERLLSWFVRLQGVVVLWLAGVFLLPKPLSEFLWRLIFRR